MKPYSSVGVFTTMLSDGRKGPKVGLRRWANAPRNGTSHGAGPMVLCIRWGERGGGARIRPHPLAVLINSQSLY